MRPGFTGSAIKGRPATTTKRDTARSIAPYFISATAKKKTPNAEGFIQRWLLLEPINKSIRSNLVFTKDYLKAQFDIEYFPNQFTVIPKDGENVKVGEQVLNFKII